MRGKITQYTVSLVLTIIASVLILPLFFLFTVGIIAGLFVEIFKFYSRISNSELREYKIYKQIEKGSPVRKIQKTFTLPLPEKVRSKGVFMSPMSEKKLSEVR